MHNQSLCANNCGSTSYICALIFFLSPFLHAITLTIVLSHRLCTVSLICLPVSGLFSLITVWNMTARFIFFYMYKLIISLLRNFHSSHYKLIQIQPPWAHIPAFLCSDPSKFPILFFPAALHVPKWPAAKLCNLLFCKNQL